MNSMNNTPQCEDENKLMDEMDTTKLQRDIENLTEDNDKPLSGYESFASTTEPRHKTCIKRYCGDMDTGSLIL